jgi:hypothetical protein
MRSPIKKWCIALGVIAFITGGLFWYADDFFKHDAGQVLAIQVGTFAQQKGYLPHNWMEFSQWSKTTHVGEWDVSALNERYRLQWGLSVDDIHDHDIVLTVLDSELRDMQSDMNSRIVMLAHLPPQTTDSR